VLRVFEENGLLKAHSSHENRTGRLLYQGDGAFRPEGSNFVITFVFDSGRARGSGHGIGATLRALVSLPPSRMLGLV